MATKHDLIKAVRNKINYLSKDDIIQSVDWVLEYLKKELSTQNRIEIRGFGTFTTRDRKLANSDKLYKTTYYRMAKQMLKELNL